MPKRESLSDWIALHLFIKSKACVGLCPRFKSQDLHKRVVAGESKSPILSALSSAIVKLSLNKGPSTTFSLQLLNEQQFTFANFQYNIICLL